MKPKAKKTLWLILRTVICVGAMCYVISNVRWDDRVTLVDGQRRKVKNWSQVLEDPHVSDPQYRDQIVILLEDPPAEITLADVARRADGRPDYEIGLHGALASADIKMLVLALVIFIPVGLIQSARFTWMIRAQDIQLSYWEGIKLSYAGNFLNFVALGSTGGDVFKAYYVSTHTHRKTEAVTAVLLDRAVGLVGLLLIATLAMAIKFDDPNVRKWWPVLAVLILGLAAGILVMFSRRIRAVLRFDHLLTKLPFSAHLIRIDAATHRLRHHKKLLALAVMTTIVLQCLAITAIILAGAGLGMNTAPHLLAGYFVYIAMGLLAAAVPVSYQGFGTMDGVLQICLYGVYGSYSQILFMGMAFRILALISSLPGALVPIMGAYRPSMEKIAQLESLAAPSES